MQFPAMWRMLWPPSHNRALLRDSKAHHPPADPPGHDAQPMSLPLFTLIHVAISLVGIAAGFGALAGWMAGRRSPRWTLVFLLTTLATSVTGFLFPYRGFTPGIGIGILSVVLLSAAIYAYYGRKLAGRQRTVFIVTSVTALYLNCLVLVVQLFQKVPALAELAPKQNEPPFVVTQLLVMATFVALGIGAVKRFREP
jgi:hypothetical protein